MRLFLLIIFISISTFSTEDNFIVDSTHVETKSIEMIPDGLLKDLNNKKVNIHDILDSRPTLISFCAIYDNI